MNRRYKRKNNLSIIKYKTTEYIENNIKSYAILILIFIIGVILSVLFINNTSDNQLDTINNYINSSINELKDNNSINSLMYIKYSVKNNTILTITLWLMGTTIIGIFIIYIIICFRGFCLGYAISSIILSIGIKKGIIFILSSLFLQNIIFIPCIITLAVSGIRSKKLNYKRQKKR